MTPLGQSDTRPEKLVVIVDGKQRTYTRDDDGLMWSYRTPEGRRWIGHLALAENLERLLIERANG